MSSGDVIATICSIFVIGIIIFTFGGMYGMKLGVERTKLEAIKAGAAVWAADEFGKPVIKWVTPTKD